MFFCSDCAIKGIRQKEDAWNAILAGFCTGGALAIRGGFKAARNSAIMCAVFLGVIEGVGIGFQRMMADNTKLEVCGIHSETILCKQHRKFEQSADYHLNIASTPSPIRTKSSGLNFPEHQRDRFTPRWSNSHLPPCFHTTFPTMSLSSQVFGLVHHLSTIRIEVSILSLLELTLLIPLYDLFSEHCILVDSGLCCWFKTGVCVLLWLGGLTLGPLSAQSAKKRRTEDLVDSCTLTHG